MGKKSRKYKGKKEEREKHNGILGVNSVAEVQFPSGPPPRSAIRRFAAECSHDDPINIRWREREKRRWLEQGSAIAQFGQKYECQSTRLPRLNDIAIIWVHCRRDELIDAQFVKIAHASPITEILSSRDYELARYKTELAIVAQCYLDQGREEFDRCLPNPIYTHYNPVHQPQWVLDMEATLDSIRKRNSALVVYLDSQVSCHCLDITQAKAEEEAAKRAGSNGTQEEPSCRHGDLSHLTDNWKSEAQNKLLEFGIFHVIHDKATYRDFASFATFFKENPDHGTSDFATFAFSVATTILVDKKKYDWAERITNVGIMAEVLAKHGQENVTEALSRMSVPKKPKMEPYLRQVYIDMYKTDAASSLLRFLQKKIPCECLDDLRGILHAQGSDRSEVCNICYGTSPKSQFLVCGGCGVEEYCSPECQTKDWMDHKTMCNCLASALK